MKSSSPPPHHPHHHRHIVTVTLLSVVVALLVLGVLAMVYLWVRHRNSLTDTFNLSQTAVACSDASKGLYCLCKKGNESQKVCFQSVDATDPNQLQVTIPLLHFSKTFSLDSLSTNEDQGQTFHVLNQEYSAFQHPCVPNTLCFRSLTDPTQPQRLCYEVSDHKSFISGPTQYQYETL